MKTYYYTDGNCQYGPFSFDELKEKNIHPTSMIWFEGLENWTPAIHIKELREFFPDVPPPVKKISSSTVAQHKTDAGPNHFQVPPKNWFVESLLLTIFCCPPFGIPALIAASKVEGRFYAGDIEGAKRAAAEAQKWTKIGFFVGIGIVGLYILVFVIQFLFLAGSFFSIFSNLPK